LSRALSRAEQKRRRVTWGKEVGERRDSGGVTQDTHLLYIHNVGHRLNWKRSDSTERNA